MRVGAYAITIVIVATLANQAFDHTALEVWDVALRVALGGLAGVCLAWSFLRV